jgi:hypothetical protein
MLRPSGNVNIKNFYALKKIPATFLYFYKKTLTFCKKKDMIYENNIILGGQ